MRMRLMVSLVASLALAGVGLFTTACGKSITEPSPVTTKSSGGTHPTVAATPSTTASPDPTNSATTDAPEVVYQGAQFIVHNPTGHDVVYRMCFYQMSEPYTFQNQHFLGQSLNVTAPKQTSDTVIPIPELPIACGKTIVVQADPWKGGTECPTDPRSIDERGTPNITLRGPDCRCDDYEKPSITGDIAMVVDTDAGVAHITRGSVAPAAVSLNPALPVDITQPAYGQPATEFSTTGTLSFGPAELQCSVSKPFTKTVPPQEHVRDCEDMAAHCSAVSVNTSDIIATVKTTCTWTPPPPTGLLQLPEYATTVAPGEMHPYDVARTSHAQTINISLKLSGQVCATASAVVEAKRCEEAQSGIVTVKADTHENGEYAYRVCTELYTSGGNRNQCKTATVVWQDWIERGHTKSFAYAPDGKTLYVQVNLDRRDGGQETPHGPWEASDSSVHATCSDAHANWNESIAYACHSTCEHDN